MKLKLSLFRKTLWALPCLTILLTACTTVDPAPFSQFAETLRDLRNATDAQAAANAKTERQRLVATVEANPADVANLQLGFPTDFVAAYGTFEEQDPEPLYFKLARFQAGLEALNNAMVGYADALVALAGDQALNPDEFKQLTDDLNTNAGSAAKALKLKIPADQQALISTLAVEAFQLYIEKKRRKSLVEAIHLVQPSIESFSKAAQKAVRLLAIDVKANYADEGFASRTNPPLDVEAILEYNEQTEQTLATLGTLWTSYGQLPSAHNDLAAAARKRQRGLAGLLALTDEAIRLRSLTETLTAANQAAANGQ